MTGKAEEGNKMVGQQVELEPTYVVDVFVQYGIVETIMQKSSSNISMT